MKKILFVMLLFMLVAVPCGRASASDGLAVIDSNTEMYDSKTGINDFQQIIDKLQELKNIDWKQSAPVFYLNLHDFNKDMKDENLIFCDFKRLETVSFGGFTVIEYFRMLISAFLYWNTGMFVYRELGRALPS